MNEKHYDLRFLPLFEDDLNEIVDYITYRLRNPAAAERLVDDVEAAILERLPCAESFEPFHSARERLFFVKYFSLKKASEFPFFSK